MPRPKPPTLQKALATIGDIRLAASRETIALDETFNVTLNFKMLGHLRETFVQTAWEEAYDAHDTVMRMRYFVGLDKIIGGLVRKKVIEPVTLARTAKFYWSRNPELPHRIWVMIINQDQIPRLPNSEDEARELFFNVTKVFSILGADLGRGKHSISARIKAKWGRHSFIEHGTIQKFSEPIRIHCR